MHVNPHSGRDSREDRGEDVIDVAAGLDRVGGVDEEHVALVEQLDDLLRVEVLSASCADDRSLDLAKRRCGERVGIVDSMLDRVAVAGVAMGRLLNEVAGSARAPTR